MKKSLFTHSFALFFSLLLVACSTTPLPPALGGPPVEKKEEPVITKTYFSQIKPEINNDLSSVISPECVNNAKYARSIAVLKEAGIPVISLEEYMTTPAVTTMPMRTIQFYTVANSGTPAQLYADILLTCHKVGWTKLEAVLKAKTPTIVDGLKLSTELKR